MMLDQLKTDLVFQRDGFLYEHETTISAVREFGDLPDTQRALFKSAASDAWVLVATSTIFHPQGGGQPSDTGMIAAKDGSGPMFHVQDVRADAAGTVLHLGEFDGEAKPFASAQAVQMTIDKEKRILFSRYHTAGHVLGAAVRHLLQDSIEGFDELKASHFPDSAACEFQGLIAGTHKQAIQARLDEYVKKNMPVEIDWWDEDDFKNNGLERLIPDREAMGLAEGEKFRVVKIIGAEVYPCGGTHVKTTTECEKTVVKKIGRSKGTSRVSYLLQ